MNSYHHSQIAAFLIFFFGRVEAADRKECVQEKRVKCSNYYVGSLHDGVAV